MKRILVLLVSLLVVGNAYGLSYSVKIETDCKREQPTVFVDGKKIDYWPELIFKKTGRYKVSVRCATYPIAEYIEVGENLKVFVRFSSSPYGFTVRRLKDGSVKLPPAPAPKPDDNKIVRTSSGTGFFVSRSGHIITNHHVVEECKSVKVSFMGNEVKASVLGVDRHNDLAILNTALNPKDVYSVSGEDAALLDDLMLKLRDIAEKAETFTVLVGCWQ